MWMVVLALFIGGIALILAEFFVPGAVLGVLGAMLLMASMVVDYMYYPDTIVFVVVGELLGAVFIVLTGMYFISHSPAGQFMVLKASQRKEEGYASPNESTALIGREGVAHVALRPAGTVMIDGERIDAVSDGTFIDKGARIRVIDVEGHRVVVEAIPEA